ncbi:hypothetical protein V7128_17210 [Neobacillus vireti]|uniref:hypothetical protein n=1 Tax=Neobacillus vireti TaxID=220686 RepID=UPI002FFDBE6B
MPLLETVEGVGVDDIACHSSFYEETKLSLTTRVNRMYTYQLGWKIRQHGIAQFISNIMVEATKNPMNLKLLVISYIKEA